MIPPAFAGRTVVVNDLFVFGNASTYGANGRTSACARGMSSGNFAFSAAAGHGLVEDRGDYAGIAPRQNFQIVMLRKSRLNGTESQCQAKFVAQTAIE